MNVKTSYSILEQNDDYIKWDDKFLIGIPVVDEEHKTLVKLCNDFYQSLLKKMDEKERMTLVKTTLSECARYTINHFEHEEKLMKACSFSGFAQHKAVHDSFRMKVLETSSGIESMTISDALKFARFLYDWILSHIAHEDRLYFKDLVTYLNGQKK